MSDIPELRDLTVFAAVCRERSFSRAAAALESSQPRVSTRMAALESRLGTPLFVRTSRGVMPTAAAEALLPYALRCLELVAEGWRAAGEAQQVLQLRVNAPDLLATTVFPRLLLGLEERRVQLVPNTGHSAEVIAALLDGLCDLGLILGRSAPAGLEVHPLHFTPNVCVVPPEHPLPEVAAPEQLGELPVIVPLGQDFAELMARLGIRRWSALEPVAAVRAAALETGRAAILPRLAVRNELRHGSLRELRLKSGAAAELGGWPVSAVLPRRKRQSAQARAALEVLSRFDWGGTQRVS
ncbi:DNA-binding transcriptional LysR family regulator [Deinobacterium chartae]|uniref:DNA-binding transcriptional LysR family regulator n=1 Tax=Deinobacterium chartae TaxID=521158 RepID=A0A841HXT3_9DEIO|nr:LysR family transcriptional regulator [Deinobacterium chartae]MBB6098351.1 DNA-binding transcriptional LysR family regulator [Deinobacterium chartae]